MNKKFKSMLIRTLTGFGLAAVLLGFVFLTEISQYFFDAYALATAAFCTYEMIGAVKRGGYKPHVVPICISFALFYPLMALFNVFGLSVTLAYCIALAVSLFLAFGFFIFDTNSDMKSFMVTIFIMIYPIALMNILFWLGFNFGMIPILLSAGAAMMSDAFAYFGGSLIKGPRPFPKISPKKTYSGYAFGVIGGAVGALIIYAMFEVANLPMNDAFRFSDRFTKGITIAIYCAIGFATAIIAEIGDLAASRVKREFRLSDFSNTFGSHGGVMDRLDSIMFSELFIALIMAFFM